MFSTLRGLVPVIPILVFLAAACGSPTSDTVSADPEAGAAGVPDAEVEATSLLGAPLTRSTFPADTRARMESQLADAQAEFDRTPGADTAIWLGRRTAYLGRYRDAIAIYTEALQASPNDPRLYRHRGHRRLSIRELDAAIRDFERAVDLIDGQPDEVEPDGQPNERGIPTSTLHSNIWYHLALARYLQGDFAGAADGWQQARAAVENPDNLVAASHWLYISLMRAGRPDEAQAVLEPITPDLDVIENGSYHSLLLLYKGDRTAAEVLDAAGGGSAGSAVRYGVGAWHFVNGRETDARAIWDDILEGSDWASFGFIAAEAEVARAGGASEL